MQNVIDSVTKKDPELGQRVSSYFSERKEIADKGKIAKFEWPAVNSQESPQKAKEIERHLEQVFDFNERTGQLINDLFAKGFPVEATIITASISVTTEEISSTPSVM